MGWLLVLLPFAALFSCWFATRRWPASRVLVGAFISEAAILGLLPWLLSGSYFSPGDYIRIWGRLTCLALTTTAGILVGTMAGNYRR